MNELTKDERDKLLAEWNAIRTQLRTGDDLEVEERRALDQRGDSVLEEYVNRLPKVPIGRCSVNGEVSYKRMDLFGLDGKWWYTGCPDIPVQACTHFITYQGAFNLNGEKPEGCSPRAIHEIRPGPEVPFVIPRLLKMDGMSCVISSRKILDDKYTLYFMAYYSAKPIMGAQSHQNWLRTSFTFVGKMGHPNWNSSTDPWDFDLDSWRKQPGKIYWIAPDDETLSLRPGEDSNFPFSNLPGEKSPQIFKQGQVFPLPPPSGEPISPGD